MVPLVSDYYAVKHLGEEIKRETDKVGIGVGSGAELGIATETNYTKTNGVSFSLGLGVHQGYKCKFSVICFYYSLVGWQSQGFDDILA